MITSASERCLRQIMLFGRFKIRICLLEELEIPLNKIAFDLLHFVSSKHRICLQRKHCRAQFVALEQQS